MKDLYFFSNHFFQTHGIEQASKKWDEVKIKMKSTIDLLDSMQGMYIFVCVCCRGYHKTNIIQFKVQLKSM